MTFAPRSPRLRAALVASCASAALLVSGCAGTSPVQSDEPYQPGDGVSTSVGDVDVRGLVLVADSADGPATVAGQAVNNSGEPVTLTFGLKDVGGTATAEVPAWKSVPLSQDTAVTLPKVGTAPGGVVTLVVSSAKGGEQVLTTPVLPATGYYSHLAK